MKRGKSIGFLFVGAVLLTPFGTGDVEAFPRRRFAPAPMVVTAPPVVVAPAPMITTELAPAVVNPYVAPFPYYNILPPTLPYVTHARYGYGYDGRQKTAEDYGYGPQYFEQPPRKRAPTAPPEPEIDRSAELRKVRFEVTVPTDDAIVKIDGVQTRQLGRQRVFMTPALEDDRIYTSTIEVFWTVGNEKHSDKQSFDFFPGDIVRYPSAKKINP